MRVEDEMGASFRYVSPEQEGIFPGHVKGREVSIVKHIIIMFWFLQ